MKSINGKLIMQKSKIAVLNVVSYILWFIIAKAGMNKIFILLILIFCKDTIDFIRKIGKPFVRSTENVVFKKYCL